MQNPCRRQAIIITAGCGPRPGPAAAADRPAAAAPHDTFPANNNRPEEMRTSCCQQPAPPPRNAAKMSPRISIGPEPVLASHAPSQPAAGSHCQAREVSAPHHYYWLCTTHKLDRATKEEIKIYPIDFAPVADKPHFKLITITNVSLVVNSFFPFEKGYVRWEVHKLHELVDISELLSAFHADAKIKVLA